MPGSAIFRRQLAMGTVFDAAMIEIDHPAGYAYFWNGIGTLDFGGKAYRGVGGIGQVSAIPSSIDVEIIEVHFTLSGVDPDLLDGLDDSVKGRHAYVYAAMLDERYRVIERDLVIDARCDYQVYKVDASGKASIDLVANAGLFFLRRKSAAKWSPEQAKDSYPDETGFDEVYRQEDLQDQWRAS